MTDVDQAKATQLHNIEAKTGHSIQDVLNASKAKFAHALRSVPRR